MSGRLWSPAMVGAATGVDAVGIVGLTAAWWGMSGAVRFADQLPWLALAVTGLVVSGVGNGTLLLAARARLARRARSFTIADMDVPSSDGPPAGADRAEALAAVSAVSAPTMTRYHRPDCLLVAGKTVDGGRAGDFGPLGKRPCGVCRP